MLLDRLWNTLRSRRLRLDLDRELEFHLDERIDELIGQGLGPGEARRLARAQFGNRMRHTEEARDADIWMWLDARIRDVRHAVRALLHAPVFATTVVATLALGIGANAAVFSVIDAVLLRPLPYPDADRLVQIRQIQERSAETNIAPVRLEEWNRMSPAFEAISGYYMENVSDTSGPIPERVRRAFVAPRFFDVWGVAPALGRPFNADDHRGTGLPVVIVSDRYWRTRLNADPHAIGRTIRIGSTAYPVIGVMPASFLFPDRRVDVWFPLGIDDRYAQSRLATWYIGVGRLKPGVGEEAARANLRVVQSQLARQYPTTDAKLGVEIEPLKDVTVGSIRRSLWMVFGAVSLLLLITCTNIAALLLSRAVHRGHELALRLALGASRAAVALHVLTETLMLALSGAALGLLLAFGASWALRASVPTLPRVDEIAVNARIVLYTLAVALGVAVLCGLIPAMRAGRASRRGTLAESTRTIVSARGPLQAVLVAAQVALSVVLLSGAGLLVRSAHALSRVDRGFDADGVLTFRISGNFGETADYVRLRARIDDTLARLRTIPGVSAAATALFPPGVPAEFETTFTFVEDSSRDERLVADLRVVSPAYFATMGIPIVEGAACRKQPPGDPTELLVNRAFIARYLSGRPSAIGRHLSTGDAASAAGRIVGVAADARERGLDRAPGPTVYPCNSAPNPTPVFLVRSRVAAADLAPQVRLAIREQDPFRSVYDLTPLDQRIDDAFAENRLRMNLLVFFSTAALMLACVGVYGTLSYAVDLRRREMALRMALGAGRAGIVGHVLARAAVTVAAAVAAGLMMSIATSRVLSGMLFGVSPNDPIVLMLVAALVLAVAGLAALIPAVRAARVEPLAALRDA